MAVKKEMVQRVLAIIVDFKSTADAQALSLQIASQIKPGRGLDLKILHFDNGNFPKTTLSPAQLANQITYQRSEINLGYAGALNEAVLETRKLGKKFDAYWFLNSDLEIETGTNCINKLVQVLNLHPQVGAVGPRVLDARKQGKIWGARGKVSPFFRNHFDDRLEGRLLARKFLYSRL